MKPELRDRRRKRTIEPECDTMQKVLILNRDEAAARPLGNMLEQEGFVQMTATNPETALQRIRTHHPQLFLVNLPLDGIGSVELCRQIYASNIKTPTILLGERTDDMDEILCLETGADDYIVKPVSPRELLARIRALLRRTTAAPATSLIRFGDVEIDRLRRVVTCRGDEVKITPCEYKLLLFFIQNTDRALTRDAILNSVWGYNEYPVTRTVDAHVSKLRNKFELSPATPRHFMTVHGVGYRFLM